MNIQPANPVIFGSSNLQNSSIQPLSQVPEVATDSTTLAPIQQPALTNRNSLQPDRSNANVRGRISERSDTGSTSPSELSTSETSDDELETETSDESGEFSSVRFTEQELATLRKLKARDLEVRTHEQAHQAVGGRYASAPTYEYERGPDGTNYAVSGEVAIQLPNQSASAQEVIRQADQVIRAALAPAEPSAQDRQVAAQATQAKVEATQRLQEEQQQQQDNDSTAQSSSSQSERAIERFVENSGFDEIAIGEIISAVA